MVAAYRLGLAIIETPAVTKAWGRKAAELLHLRTPVHRAFSRKSDDTDVAWVGAECRALKAARVGAAERGPDGKR
jgi:hypothetical protein